MSTPPHTILMSMSILVDYGILASTRRVGYEGSRPRYTRPLPRTSYSYAVGYVLVGVWILEFRSLVNLGVWILDML